jgi:hypothetical protein
MLRDITIVVLVVIVWLWTLVGAYEDGRETGYWEYEAEENLYSCPIAPEEDWI